MNKKLFSWKALAGLALLVAMGLTSCKQGTEVDPNDPYNTTKPVTPGSTTKGSANVTITVVAGTDLVTEYNKWVATLNADQKKAIADAKEFTIGVNAKGYKLDGVALTLPAVWANPTDKTLNIVFTNGFAEAKKPLIIDADKNNTNANVNITLPAGEYSLDLTAAGGRPTIKSEGGATVSTLTGILPTAAKNLLTIGDGVTVKVLDLNQDVKTAGSGNAVAAKLVGGTYTGEDDGTIKKNGLNFKNLEIVGTVDVNGKAGDKKLKLDNVHVNGAGWLRLGTWDATNAKWVDANVESIANISGDLDDSKALQARVYADAIVGKLSKVKLYPLTAKTTEIKDGSALDNVMAMKPVKASANIGSISNVLFDDLVTINFDKSNVNFAFKGVKFNSTINVEGKVESETVNTYATYKYSVATGWAPVADDPSVAVNSDIASFSGGKFYKADGKTEVVPAEDIVRFKTGSSTLTTVPENTSITLDKATVDTNKITGANVTSLFGGAKSIDPGYAVILNDVKYTWKKTTDDPKVTLAYELRK
jgi:hypothetical protein